MVYPQPSKKTAPSCLHEAGVALITALLVVAIVTSTAVSMAARQFRDIRHSANLLGRDQAYMIALGGEFWAKQVLAEDLKAGNTDTLEEIWASQPAAISVQGGSIEGRIYDRQALFNLNTVVDPNGKYNPLGMDRFQRLLEHLELNPALAVAVADWIDGNQEIGGVGGAEDETYLSRIPPYFTANRPMLSVSELALIEGFTAESVEKLKPWVVVLPEATPINVNTAPEEIIQILAPQLSAMEAKAVIQSRQGKGFSNVADFLQHPVIQRNNVSDQGLSVASSYFQARLFARVGRGQIRLFSLFSRQGEQVTLLRRSQGVE